ncbi:MAG TPA: hypothetical protein VLM88_10995 [Proteiniclasticum sp.]|nr:hypothetical protein [Proteiniclasticum sp.]
MEYAAIILLVMFVLNSVILLITKAKKMKIQNAGGEPKNIPFINKFFQYSFVPTFFLQILLNVEFYEFVILYTYFAIILYIANYAYKKTISKDNSQILNG